MEAWVLSHENIKTSPNNELEVRKWFVCIEDIISSIICMFFYCQPLIHIVFLFTNNSDLQNDCSWLLISPQTEEFDIVELAAEGSWRYENI